MHVVGLMCFKHLEGPTKLMEVANRGLKMQLGRDLQSFSQRRGGGAGGISSCMAAPLNCSTQIRERTENGHNMGPFRNHNELNASILFLHEMN